MAIFKPSNLSPNMTEIDVTQSFEIKFEVHTAGSNVSAYELKIYKEFNVEDDEDGEKSIVYQQAGNFADPDTYTNGDEVTITVPSDNGLKNEENYRWSIRVYQDTIPSDPSAADYAANLLAITSNSIVPTYVGEDMIVGSTRDVIWSPDYNYNMKINNCVECRFNSLNSDFNVFEKVDGVRPTYLSYTTLTSMSNIYGPNTGTVNCLEIQPSQIDKKHFEKLTDKQGYLLISTTDTSFSQPITVQIQDIIKSGNNFYVVPYTQNFIRSTVSGSSMIPNDRYAPFYQEIPQSGYYTFEYRQRSTITDMYKNVGEQNLTELLLETPFKYSYKDIASSKQNAGIYSSLGLQDELIEDPNETKEQNIVLKTIYIKPNLRGDGDLVPTETHTSDKEIKGGWILSGSEDASYGALHSLYPINCFIKFGNFFFF